MWSLEQLSYYLGYYIRVPLFLAIGNSQIDKCLATQKACRCQPKLLASTHETAWRHVALIMGEGGGGSGP